MKVLQVVFGLGLGGVERTAQNCALASQALGHETTVLAFENGPRAGILRAAGITVIDASGLTQLPKQDFIGLHSHALDPGAVDHLLRTQSQAITCEQNVFSTPSPWMEHIDVSFQLSPWAHWLYGTRGGDLDRSSTLCNPVDPTSFWRDGQGATDFRREHGIALEATVLGRVGQPLAMKWSPAMYSAVCDEVTRDRSLHLLLIGAPPEIVSSVTSRLPAAQYTIIDRVETDTELRAAYSAMDLFVHAARQGESFGNVIAEAGLCEVPTLTIATPWADNSQGYVAGPAGYVASTRHEFVSLLRHALVDRDDLVRRGRVSRQHVMETFTAQTVMERVMEITRGEQPRSLAPSTRELRTEAYLGRTPNALAPRLAFGKRSLLLGPLTGQESWTWALTVQVNSWGISRHGFVRPHAR